MYLSLLTQLFSFSWVKMRLHTESKLPASALKVPVRGWGGFLPIIKSLPTDAEEFEDKEFKED